MITRSALAAAVLLTTTLIQATLLGPLFLPLPVSLPLVVVLSVAVMSGPSAGIALGFGAGLLIDLCSTHPVGVLAAIWLGAGLAGGWLGGMVGRVRAQALLVGALGTLSAATTAIVLTALDSAAAPLSVLLARTGPGGLLDAILAVVVVPLASGVLGSPALRRAGAAPRAMVVEPTLPLAPWGAR